MSDETPGYEPHFALEHATLCFGATTALDTIALNVDRGEAVALIGPSGAGKTSLLRLLNATCFASSGTVKARGVVLSHFSQGELQRYRRTIGVIYQDFNLIPNVRVLRNVLLGRVGQQSLIGTLQSLLFPSADETSKVYELLSQVGIEDKIYQSTASLSGGQQQRAAIARALYQQPEALLADEPVSNLDPARAEETISLLCEICREHELTFVASLHNLPLARKFFPRLIGLRHGQIAFDKPAHAVSDAEFTALYELDHEDMLDD